MITILGTAHGFIIPRLKEKVKDIIVQKNPEAVCLELDKGRYEALRQKENPHFQYGDDMRGGMLGAKEVGAELYLVDRDIGETRKRLMRAVGQEIRPGEILGKAVYLLSSAFNLLARSPTKFISSFEMDPDSYRERLGNLFPFFSYVILEEREDYMTEKIIRVSDKHSRVLIVTGAAHIKGLTEKLSPFEPEVIDLLAS
jgi:pheromone shutdown protein TraB